MRSSRKHNDSPTPTRELCILYLPNFAYARSCPSPQIPKSGLKSLSIRTLPILGGGGPAKV